MSKGFLITGDETCVIEPPVQTHDFQDSAFRVVVGRNPFRLKALRKFKRFDRQIGGFVLLPVGTAPSADRNLRGLIPQFGGLPGVGIGDRSRPAAGGSKAGPAARGPRCAAASIPHRCAEDCCSERVRISRSVLAEPDPELVVTNPHAGRTGPAPARPVRPPSPECGDGPEVILGTAVVDVLAISLPWSS